MATVTVDTTLEYPGSASAAVFVEAVFDDGTRQEVPAGAGRVLTSRSDVLVVTDAGDGVALTGPAFAG